MPILMILEVVGWMLGLYIYFWKGLYTSTSIRRMKERVGDSFVVSMSVLLSNVDWEGLQKSTY